MVLGLWLSQAKEGDASIAPSVNSLSGQCVRERQRSHAILTILVLGPTLRHFSSIENCGGGEIVWRRRDVSMSLFWGLDQRKQL